MQVIGNMHQEPNQEPSCLKARIHTNIGRLEACSSSEQLVGSLL